jgi:hypothetical protein
LVYNKGSTPGTPQNLKLKIWKKNLKVTALRMQSAMAAGWLLQ